MIVKDLKQIFQILNVKPETEYKFHPQRRFKADYAFPDKKLLIEYEGLICNKSRHLTLMGYSKDCVKYNEAALLGWKVLRFTALMIRDGSAFEQLERILSKR